MGAYAGGALPHPLHDNECGGLGGVRERGGGNLNWGGVCSILFAYMNE